MNVLAVIRQFILINKSLILIKADMDLLSAVVIILIVSAVTGTRKWVLRMWHRKKFCESNRALCRALVTAGFPDFKKYLYFKEDASSYDEHRFEDGYINFYKKIVNAINNGTILPERHGSLKDINDLIPTCKFTPSYSCDGGSCNTCRFYAVEYNNIINAPIIIKAN